MSRCDYISIVIFYSRRLLSPLLLHFFLCLLLGLLGRELLALSTGSLRLLTSFLAILTAATSTIDIDAGAASVCVDFRLVNMLKLRH